MQGFGITAEEDWWNDTPWVEIRRQAQLMLSPAAFAAWLKREDVVERSKCEP